ncbi:hypothetical protein DNU06_13515 [Putridiphycobacter roseus]|uniref:Ig-like domain-containing protein n=1 Tax=Putridiphycobacter roseus TaxID=2219161 RepID=A0A2W1NE32_9FLAO|nr:gliding motility-associated C-terminal domain-containing protein [Putridiphycobacter roseus]PZE16326.1 hypothetical protein DNU06_13515 [Putridiphycobacter roseus]
MKNYKAVLLLLLLSNLPNIAKAQCNLDLGNDTVICPPDLFQLDAGPNFANYLWQDGTSNQTTFVTGPGVYWCEVNSLSNNLIVNGDFSAGSTNFTSDYTVGAGGTWGPVSNVETYFVTTNSSTAHSNFASCGDHTNGTGNMMVINGSTTVNQNIWCQNVTVLPNTNYVLSAWFQVYGSNAPDIAFMINGTQAGTSFLDNTTAACDWVNHSVVWNSGVNTSADVCFVNSVLTQNGNDFSMDDISFGTVCTVRDTLVVANASIQATLTNVVAASCANAADGTATISNITGTSGGPYTVTWTDPTGNVHDVNTVAQNGSFTQSNLFLGNWTVNISDGTGCDYNTNFNIQSGSIAIDVTSNNPQCFGTATGSISATTSTSGTFNFVITDAAGTVVNNTGTNTANNLVAGTYTVTYSDGSGCDIAEVVELTDPAQISASIATVDPLCHNDITGIAYVASITNFQGDAASIYYSWLPIGINGLLKDSVNGLAPGTHELKVVDGVGCENAFSFTILNPDPLKATVEVTSKTYCRTADFQNGNGVVIGYTAGNDSSGTGSVSYEWENLVNGDISNFSTFVVKTPGDMQLTITDANGCQDISTVYVDSLNPIANFSVASDEFLNPSIYEGTEPVKIKITNLSENFAQIGNPLSDTIFQWNLNSSNITTDGKWFFTYDLNEKVDTIYTGEAIYEVCMVAKNYNDCVDTSCTEIIVHSVVDLVIPNVFTPGAYPNNEFFFPSSGVKTFNSVVYNRYGVPVFEFLDIDDKWDGNHYKSGKPCSEGVYFFTYKGESTNGLKLEGNGNVELIRGKK